MTTSHTFTVRERLKSRKLIGRLFKDGHSYVAYPLRVVWQTIPHPHFPDVHAQVSISVSRRVFKTAVARNVLKRRIREAYRLHKHDLMAKLAAAELHIALMLIYVGKEELPYADIEAGVKKMIRKFPGTDAPQPKNK